MKPSNKIRLAKLAKRIRKTDYSVRVIIYDPNDPLPETKGPGPFIFLPDNGHRFPHNPDREEEG